MILKVENPQNKNKNKFIFAADCVKSDTLLKRFTAFLLNLILECIQ